jgi:CheY-like chemotaxis protein
MTQLRVLLVEDDPSIQRFVTLALEDLPVHLLVCGSVADARNHLARTPVQLILLDFMLPGESGLALLRQAQATPRLLGGARVALFSAGISPALRSQLEGLPVWRELPKPVPLTTLRNCIADALAQTHEGRPDAIAEVAAAAADEASAIAEHFGGDVQLFHKYRSMCKVQFRADIDTGDQAMAQADLDSLQRLAHSLKSVLLSLGCGTEAKRAKALETTTRIGDAAASRALWASLRTALASLAQSA